MASAVPSVNFSLSYSKTDAGKERDVMQDSNRSQMSRRTAVSIYVLLRCKV